MLLCVNENILAHNEADGDCYVGECVWECCYNCFVIGGSVVSNLKMYIAVLDIFPDYMTPTLVAHAVIGAHMQWDDIYTELPHLQDYNDWLRMSFKKCVVRVNQKEWDKIIALDNVYLAHENHTLEGRKACAVVCPREEVPNVLKFAKLWKPKEVV